MKIPIPSSWSDRPVGLGDLVKRLTDAMGIEQCGGCRRRQELFNEWITFDPGVRERGEGSAYREWEV